MGNLIMATSKEYKDFILEQLNLLDSITCKAIMGEFLLYYNDILFDDIIIYKSEW